MGMPLDRGRVNANRGFVFIEQSLGRLFDELTAFRAACATGSIDSAHLQQIYTTVTSTVFDVDGTVARVGAASIVAAYRREYTSLGSVDPGVEYEALRAKIVDFVLWVQAAGPKDAAGHPAYQAYEANTGRLTSFAIPLDDPTKIDVLARVDLVLNGFTIIVST